MRDFDFLRQHGFGVVYGEKAVRQKIFELGSIEPNKGNNMNEITYTDKPDVPAGEVLIELLDAEGNHSGWTLAPEGESETAPAGTTFVTAEDGDHEVTVH